MRAPLPVIALLGLVALAWWLTVSTMSGMDSTPGADPGAFGFFITTWVVMMAAMMLPSLGPMVVAHNRLELEQPHRVVLSLTPLFVIGYLAVWATSGLFAYVVLQAGRAWTGDVFAWQHAGQPLAAAALLIAAVYEVTPLKTACLRKCRSTFGFLVSSWRDGPGGAFITGVHQGRCCLGCSWALMVALFALGAMSLTWMVVVAAMVGVEKLLPWRRTAVAVVTATLVALSVGLLVAPTDVPGLTVPGGMTSVSPMNMMR